LVLTKPMKGKRIIFKTRFRFPTFPSKQQGLHMNIQFSIAWGQYESRCCSTQVGYWM